MKALVYLKRYKQSNRTFLYRRKWQDFGESTGMGLYITNEVCKKLNHELEIQSNEGEGTKITIYFN